MASLKKNTHVSNITDWIGCTSVIIVYINVCVCICMHAITINENGDNDFEKQQVMVYEGIWKEERRGWNGVIVYQP